MINEAMGVKKQAFSAIRWTSFMMICKAGLGIIQVAVLARFLTPADFGLISLMTAFVGFTQLFADMGISNAIVHRQNINQKELSSLFWLNFSSGVIVMCLLAILSPLIADFYNMPAIIPILQSMSVVFVISSLGQQLRVIAQKELRFERLTQIELFSSVCGVLSTVIYAILGLGVYAFVTGVLVSNVVLTVLSWIFLAKGWRPIWRLSLSEVLPFLRFGAYTIANNLVSTINVQADVLIGGRYLTTSSLGMYSLSRDINMRLAGIINPIVTRVGLPLMAKAQSDKLFLKEVYLKTLRMTASINFPIYLAILIFAPEIVVLIFGAKWTDSVPLMRLFALWGLIRSTGNPVGSLLSAVGRPDLEFKWNFGVLFVLPPLLWFGVKFGATGLVLVSLFFLLIISLPFWFVLVRPVCGANFFEYYNKLSTPFVVSVISNGVAYFAIAKLDTSLTRLCLGLLVDVLVYIVLSRSMNRVWFNNMRELAKLS
jgi:lipopolysaccharide exporter